MQKNSQSRWGDKKKEVVSKVHHLPLALRPGYSLPDTAGRLLREEGKVRVGKFPILFQGGVSCPEGHDGVVDFTFEMTPSCISAVNMVT